MTMEMMMMMMMIVTRIGLAVMDIYRRTYDEKQKKRIPAADSYNELESGRDRESEWVRFSNLSRYLFIYVFFVVVVASQFFHIHQNSSRSFGFKTLSKKKTKLLRNRAIHINEWMKINDKNGLTSMDFDNDDDDVVVVVVVVDHDTRFITNTIGWLKMCYNSTIIILTTPSWCSSSTESVPLMRLPCFWSAFFFSFISPSSSSSCASWHVCTHQSDFCPNIYTIHSFIHLDKLILDNFLVRFVFVAWFV